MPARLGELLDPVAKKLDMGDSRSLGRIYGNWSDIVGPEIAARAQPSSLRAGVLRVRTDSPTWATELGYLGPDLVARINSSLGSEVVNELRVWTGPGGRPGPEGTRRASHIKGFSQAPEDPSEALERARAAQVRTRGSKGRENRKTRR